MSLCPVRVLQPVVIGGRHRVDAGISENLPVSSAAPVAQPGDRVWLLDVTTSRTGQRGLHTPIHVLVAALAGSITNRPVTAFPPGVDVIHCKLDVPLWVRLRLSHSSTLYRLGEQTVTARLLERSSRL